MLRIRPEGADAVGPRPDLDAEFFQELSGDCTADHAARCLPSGASPAAAVIAEAVFSVISEIRMAGAVHIPERGIIPGALVRVLYDHRDRRPGGLSLEHSGEDPAEISFLPRCRKPGSARLPSVQVCLDIFLAERESRGTPVDDGPHGSTVGFPEGGDPENRSECVSCHKAPSKMNCRTLRDTAGDPDAVMSPGCGRHVSFISAGDVPTDRNAAVPALRSGRHGHAVTPRPGRSHSCSAGPHGVHWNS